MAEYCFDRKKVGTKPGHKLSSYPSNSSLTHYINELQYMVQDESIPLHLLTT